MDKNCAVVINGYKLPATSCLVGTVPWVILGRHWFLVLRDRNCALVLRDKNYLKNY